MHPKKLKQKAEAIGEAIWTELRLQGIADCSVETSYDPLVYTYFVRIGELEKEICWLTNQKTFIWIACDGVTDSASFRQMIRCVIEMLVPA